MKLEKYYCDLKNLHIGTEPNRAFYIPAGSFEAASELYAAAHSDRVQMLCGEWDFSYYNSVYEIPEACVASMGSYRPKAKITVPSVWQNFGYDNHQYINVRYPIPYDPPYVPKMNPCGVYSRNFEVSDFERLYIDFEGVDSCFYLWINGEFVGYNQVSHCTGEFEITKFAKKGNNTITVIVLKWCDGTYLEDQDKLRTSGIFRDVYLIYRPKNHIRDYKVETNLADDFSSASVSCGIEFKGKKCQVDYTFIDPAGNIVAEGVSKNGKIDIAVKNPRLWNCEEPYLYKLQLLCEGEHIVQLVGIRKISVEAGVLKINGKRIIIHGVNRHDSHPEKGPAVSFDDVHKDILLMKKYHVNGLRTSHYPNAPYMAILCSVYGLYMMEEADMEAHGIFSLYGDEKGPHNIQDNSLFQKAIVDRQELLYHRDKNNAAVIMWSVGNESGWGRNIEFSLMYLKKNDPQRLTHYQDLRPAEGTEMNLSNLDTYSRMYAPTSAIAEYCENERTKPEDERKPFILCEYCHAMGNGPGDLEDYHELLEPNPEFCGGFIWEWCDHAVNMGKAADGRVKYGYGGDFGDTQNDGNFCMDGLVRPDRTPYPSLLEFKNVMRPIRFSVNANGEVFATNMYDFVEADKFVSVSYEISVNGRTVKTEKINLPKLPAHETVKLPLVIDKNGDGHRFVRFIMTSTVENGYWNKGEELGFEQIELTKYIPEKRFSYEGKVSFTEDEMQITVNGSNFSYAFNKLVGNFSSICVKGKELLKRPMEFAIWRAPTDNDMFVRETWKKAGYDRLDFRPFDCKAEKVEGAVIITASISVCACALQRLMLIKATWIINGKGEISAKILAEKNKTMPYLPRFGVRMFLPESVSLVDYLGYGLYESYIDKHYASYFGRFSTTVDKLFEDYYCPQENGNHYGCEALTLMSDNSKIGITATQQPFEFGASYYTAEELTNTKHNYELSKCGCTVLSLDYAQSGVGSNSCGPALLEKYRLNLEEIQFGFVLNFSIE